MLLICVGLRTGWPGDGTFFILALQGLIGISFLLCLSEISKSPWWCIPGVPLAGLTESQGVPQPPRPCQLLQSLWLARVCVSEPLERTGHLWVWGALYGHTEHTESKEGIQPVYLQIAYDTVLYSGDFSQSDCLLNSKPTLSCYIVSLRLEMREICYLKNQMWNYKS